MPGTCADCVCTAPPASRDGGRLVLSTRMQHTAAQLRTAARAVGVRSHVLAPGLIELSAPDLDEVVEQLAGALSSVEAAEVRCLRTTAATAGVRLLAEAMAAPTLAAEGARLRHADLLPLFDDELSRFHCEYQPIVDLHSRNTLGHEALLRATDAAGHRLLPDELFPAAEEAGWLHVLDRIGRTTALRDAGPWLGEDSLFINFVPTSIYRAEVCLRTTQQAVREAGLDFGQLVFEVTEGHRVRDVAHLAEVFDHYREQGCRVALDDLGAGWASLNLLVGLQPDVVKLDKEIVQALPSVTASAVVTAIVDIAHSYGGVVLAECIETEAQAAAALELGVDLGQGWLFGPAVDVTGRSREAARPGIRFDPADPDAALACTDLVAAADAAPTAGDASLRSGLVAPSVG